MTLSVDRTGISIMILFTIPMYHRPANAPLFVANAEPLSLRDSRKLCRCMTYSHPNLYCRHRPCRSFRRESDGCRLTITYIRPIPHPLFSRPIHFLCHDKRIISNGPIIGCLEVQASLTYSQRLVELYQLVFLASHSKRLGMVQRMHAMA